MRCDFIKHEMRLYKSWDDMSFDCIKHEIQLYKTWASIVQSMNFDCIKHEIRFYKTWASIAQNTRFDCIKHELRLSKALISTLVRNNTSFLTHIMMYKSLWKKHYRPLSQLRIFSFTQRNNFEILLNRTEIRLYLPLFDWFGTKRTLSVCSSKSIGEW